MTGLLREELGYDGLLLTDSLEMGALRSGYPVPRAAVSALSAGADILCISHGFDIHRRVHASLMASIEQGDIPEQRLNDAVSRILWAKAQYGLLAGAPAVSTGALSSVGSDASRELRAGSRLRRSRSSGMRASCCPLRPVRNP